MARINFASEKDMVDVYLEVNAETCSEIKLFTNIWDTLGHVPKEPDISASASLSDSELKETIKKD